MAAQLVVPPLVRVLFPARGLGRLALLLLVGLGVRLLAQVFCLVLGMGRLVLARAA